MELRLLILDKSHDFRNDEELNCLTLSDSSHSESSLRVVSERHIFPERQSCSGIDALVNVHSGGVDLIVKRESSMGRDTRLVHTYDVHPAPHQHHLAIHVVEENNAVELQR